MLNTLASHRHFRQSNLVQQARLFREAQRQDATSPSSAGAVAPSQAAMAVQKTLDRLRREFGVTADGKGGGGALGNTTK